MPLGEGDGQTGGKLILNASLKALDVIIAHPSRIPMIRWVHTYKL
jgi:hypothetical protein